MKLEINGVVGGAMLINNQKGVCQETQGRFTNMKGIENQSEGIQAMLQIKKLGSNLLLLLFVVFLTIMMTKN